MLIVLAKTHFVKNIWTTKSFISRLKVSHNVTTETKNFSTLKGFFIENINYLHSICHRAGFPFLCYSFTYQTVSCKVIEVLTLQEIRCVHCSMIGWATTRENLSSGFANNIGADQPAHPRSLISAFVIRFLESTIFNLATREISIF